MQYIPYDEWVGLTGGGYALRGVIGRGGAGEVRSADDLLPHRTVAVKPMHPRLALDDAARSRFQREVRAALPRAPRRAADPAPRHRARAPVPARCSSPSPVRH
ncbi:MULTISPECIES: hypothetical protein [Streptomycetaceae]|uniref:hypothetical protein n=1 Tax=Streptomycetaceae TaxID=2062 RepID=UPI00093CE8EB|nr:hypothetical protein [Streptomyces sp. CB02056]OKI03311.1 hypothetical protein AMK13_28065 [Streptomyces sp. CB02056]